MTTRAQTDASLMFVELSDGGDSLCLHVAVSLVFGEVAHYVCRHGHTVDGHARSSASFSTTCSSNERGLCLFHLSAPVDFCFTFNGVLLLCLLQDVSFFSHQGWAQLGEGMEDFVQVS